MSFGTAYMTKKRGQKCMAKGGTVEDKGIHLPISGSGGSYSEGTSAAGLHARFEKRNKHLGGGAAAPLAKKEHEQILGEMRAMPKPKLPMAEGGEVDEMGEYDPMQHPMPEENEAANMEDADMIARIMHKRKEYSKGGMVANDVGVAEADKEPAEFDDLVLDDHLEDDSGAGNEHGDADVHDDPIDRIMLKRKKDKMPRPA